ncbi:MULTISPECIES: porin [Burkholderiales]|jgi:predicted porin|uniref:Outer membrane porin protein 32 n=6 Tax=Burkholderiales TaxID=80840 RepID=A0A5E4YYK4_9BURK|nr:MULTISPECIES: porin [Burkholderiaceae]MDN4044984.1 porin [Massilia sp. YIM B02787]CAG9187721.1 Outer membrane porin protein [Cupriavidus pinatubonensis]VVE15573.1 Outer membrane porin protein 32 [Pandoraea cepalis]VVE53999.1 Outer membrane porin protein 32 [Pandoraea terrigena]
MKRTLIAAAIATACSYTHAQSSVTLYGVADAGVEFLNHVPNAAGQANSLVRMTSGNTAGSRWGLRGVEDLGNGLKGVFVLEGGMALDSGMAVQGGRLFGRKAYVGIDSSRFGQITLGRHHNLLFDLIISFDPMLFAPKYSSFNHDAWLAGRTDNSAKYTGTFGGLTVAALYSFGVDSSVANGSEVPGNSRVGRDMSAGFTYQAGKFRVGGAYDQLNGSSAVTDGKTERRYVGAVALDINPVSVYVGYRRLVSQLVTSMPRTDLLWAGVNWNLAPSFALTGAAYKTNDRTSAKDPVSFVLSADYRFSKRTDAYITASYTKNNGGSALGANGYDGSVLPGNNQFGTVIGLRHSF